MIEIVNKQNCCGCSACAQICPVQCITLHDDQEGFLYPHVDESRCVDCGLCEKVCPFINIANVREPIKVFAAINKNFDVRMKSSSGGVFSLLAEKTINEGGVVFGVKFDEKWNPVYGYTETIAGIDVFRGAKYVQAQVGTSYKDARNFLRLGRRVLFSGTPCQIAGLKRFLKTEYKNLLTVDVVCHGVPSPLVWREYIREIIMPDRSENYRKNTVLSLSEDKPVITGINFRDKKLGWKKYSFVVQAKSAVDGENTILLSDMHRQNKFMQAISLKLILRPSCYNCKVKSGKSGSDITIADFWGVERFYPQMDDDKGTSLVLLNTEKGQNLYDSIFCELEQLEIDYLKALVGNPCIMHSVKVPKHREQFWREFSMSGTDAIDHINDKIKPGYIQKIMWQLKSIIKKLIMHKHKNITIIGK